MLQLKMKFIESHLTWQICRANNRGSEVLTT
jgi:hypothetical protein